MAIRMAKLTRTSTGLWTARKAIPEDVRAAYGKREEKPTWPATLTSGEAKSAFTEWLGEVEGRIANLRKAAKGEATRLTHRQIVALSGEWYRREVQAYEDDPGDEVGWDVALDQLQPEEPEEAYAAYMRGEGYEGAMKRIPRIVGQVDELLGAEGLHVDRDTRERLLDHVHERYVDLCILMRRRARGDYSPDPAAPSIPAWELPRPVAAGPSITELFDGYVAERGPAPATVKAWKRQLNHLIAFLGHEDAGRVTADDMLRWKDHLLEPDDLGKRRSGKTVRETYLAAAKTVFGWAKENRKVPSNPAAEVRVRVAPAVRLREPGLTESEANIILAASLKAQPESLTPEHRFARRWVPWLCAYTGARVGEITQLRAEDIAKVEGVWSVWITPEAGAVKTHRARRVPLHADLIAQGPR